LGETTKFYRIIETLKPFEFSPILRIFARLELSIKHIFVQAQYLNETEYGARQGDDNGGERLQ